MRRWAPALIAVLALAACGKAGPPIAPQLMAPVPVSDLRGSVEDGAIVLTWTSPQRRTDGTRVRDLTQARVYRTEDAGFLQPKPALLTQRRIAGYQEIAVIRLAAPAPAVMQGGRVRLVDREGLRLRQRYTYVVITEDSMGRVSPPSGRLSLTFLTPPGAPPAPTVEAGDAEVRVRWQPPARLLDHGEPEPLAYEVLRAPTADGPADVVLAIPAGQTETLDKNVENDRTYYYAVRAIGQEAGTAARGQPSPRVAATPGRTTPPAPPATLVATPSADSVRLSWAASPDPNVAGYVVYRGGPTGGLARIGSTRAPTTTFTDRDLAPGTYRYSVTAQDATARATESARANEVTVTLP